jgi:RHH-type proline utilization regulon transcriptional repressor/proline dehydrogenase/delta 1-pyrroline-5-carboxylate dehydrogenase
MEIRELNLPNMPSGNENELVASFLPELQFEHAPIKSRAEKLINIIRDNNEFGIEEFMQHFSLSTEEGLAIMCLAEGLLRIPDRHIASKLALDRLSNKNWKVYLGKSRSLKSNITSFGLYVSGIFADVSNKDNTLLKLISRLGRPAFLGIVTQAIKFLSKEFIFGDNIKVAINNCSNFAKYRFSFDLLGESSRTLEQAEHYYLEYIKSIDELAKANPYNSTMDEFDRPNLSVKLTALYPRLELNKKEDVDEYLLPKLVELVKKVRDNKLTITFDAEEARRLDIYLHVLTHLVTHEELKDFSNIGFVVQAYQTRATFVIDYIIQLAKNTGKRIPVRLVKGAYWDYEIKYAQENGLSTYPVFTKKEYTDASYITCAQKILKAEDYIFPQFATHNALTTGTIIELAGTKKFEFQKLHGMGKRLHNELLKNYKIRIYAPVGRMHDLLAYLMRRMLENGANACFVNQVNNPKIAPKDLAYDLHEKVSSLLKLGQSILLPKDIYTNRENAMGYDLGYKENLETINTEVSKFYTKVHKISSILEGKENFSEKYTLEHFCPANTAEKFSSVSYATDSEIVQTVDYAQKGFIDWTIRDYKDRANILRKIADLYEENKYELYSLLIKEGGKSITDAINEVIEAIDFCRYYANQAELHISPKDMPGPTGESNILSFHGRGVFLCISPWNFPLAIFTGQVVAALVTGNSVIAKPANQTPVVAHFAVNLMHKAGVPQSALHLLIASGSNIGKILLPDDRISGVVFTGSTETAKLINLSLAERKGAIVPFIAETGGQNAMIVDSSALLEQVTDDVLISAFYSAGQRCSALRILYIQEEIYDPLISMIKQAMEILKIGNTTDFSNDIGPVIDKKSLENLTHHVRYMVEKGFKLIASHPQSGQKPEGTFFLPHIIEVNSINDIPDEKFGPILHVAKYKATELNKVIEDVNGYGFGLTFGLHSRIERQIDEISSKIKAGNIYANRSMVGAKVESQPFGGENKSGTGFKAGGPYYLLRFMLERTKTINLTAIGGNVELLSK